MVIFIQSKTAEICQKGTHRCSDPNKNDLRKEFKEQASEMSGVNSYVSNLQDESATVLSQLSTQPEVVTSWCQAIRNKWAFPFIGVGWSETVINKTALPIANGDDLYYHLKHLGQDRVSVAVRKYMANKDMAVMDPPDDDYRFTTCDIMWVENNEVYCCHFFFGMEEAFAEISTTEIKTRTYDEVSY